MIRAYNEWYLSDARRCLANSLDYAVYSLGIGLSEYYDMFIESDVCTRFEKGDPFIVSGKSGVELALMIVSQYRGEQDYMERVYHDGKSREYWAGWALAFHQWYTACTLRQLNNEIPIETILDMYDKYHEMDIMHFVDRITEMRRERRLTTYLKKLREFKGFSQSELAAMTGIPLKTLQHYEQGDKQLNKANVMYVLTLARVLDCNPEVLIES